jgi:plastocyanin
MKRSVGFTSRLLTVSTLLIAILLISNSCNKSSYNYATGMSNNPYGTASVPGKNEVFIQGMSFTPATITVTAGTTITWTNKDGYAHTVTSDSKIFDSGNLASGSTFSYTFATAGTYPYHCGIHTSMTATVVVN